MDWPERELKFVLADARVGGFLDVASAELAVETHERRAPVAYTRTTYLDTDDHALFRATGSVRRRLRIREYASAPDLSHAPRLTGVSYLEIKQSEGAARAKVRARLGPVDLHRLLGGASPLAELDALGCQTTWDVRDWLSEHSVRPQISTWYRRTSLVARGLRVTLDHGVAFCAPPALEAARLARPGQIIANWPHTVLEIKLSGELPAWLADQVGELQEARGMSKFDAGMTALAARSVRAA